MTTLQIEPTKIVDFSKVDIGSVKLSSPEFKANPFPYYTFLRNEAPVLRVAFRGIREPIWLITRYEDVVAVLKNDQHFIKNVRNAKSQDQLKKDPWMPPLFNAFANNILDVDGPHHRRLRGLIHKAFTPSMIEHMRGQVEQIANELIDAGVRKGHMDLIADYALPIPLTIISNILGIPTEDSDKFHRWSKKIVSLSGSRNIWSAIPAMMGITRYLRKMVKNRRANPQDDLVSAMIQAEESGEHLSEDELLAMVLVLIIAGHETTVNLIASGTLSLLEFPDQMALLRSQPELLKSAIEELLRHASPIEQATERYAAEDITMHGITIPKGEMVLAVLASANRDERQFERPDEVDITRTNNKHVAFG